MTLWNRELGKAHNNFFEDGFSSPKKSSQIFGQFTGGCFRRWRCGWTTATHPATTMFIWTSYRWTWTATGMPSPSRRGAIRVRRTWRRQTGSTCIQSRHFPGQRFISLMNLIRIHSHFQLNKLHTISFEKVKLTNNLADNNGHVSVFFYSIFNCTFVSHISFLQNFEYFL